MKEQELKKLQVGDKVQLYQEHIKKYTKLLETNGVTTIIRILPWLNSKSFITEVDGFYTGMWNGTGFKKVIKEDFFEEYNYLFKVK